MLSVNTNYSAMIALQNLNFTNTELEGVQNKISTGLKISSARDNGAIYAIAEGQRSRVASVAAVKDGIDRANSTLDVALAAQQPAPKPQSLYELLGVAEPGLRGAALDAAGGAGSTVAWYWAYAAISAGCLAAPLAVRLAARRHVRTHLHPAQ